ncbi:hypothetical protein BO99DRAFT_196652 [Aspergillus violaceofuscus CBS 115571]|uniref:Uncharacterized protein n=1 Tax=Aspergillus violaceofuscus (strain CBS 115571) TaxID=1450538 RepID=A0A2V5H8K1_ASPV1|nr:hypothetical protein BO99DRAFT_196652 [Aspergillus violaceofuscus CBS 115571]
MYGRWGVTRISQESLCHRLISRGALIVKLAHMTMISFDAHPFDTFHVRGRRALVDDQLASALDVTGQGFMEEIDVEAARDVCEEAVDVLERFVVCLEGFDQVRRGFHELLRHHSTTNVLQKRAPLGDVGPIVGCSEEQDAVRGNVYGSEMLDLFVVHAPAVNEGALDDQAAQRVANEDYGSV